MKWFCRQCTMHGKGASSASFAKGTFTAATLNPIASAADFSPRNETPSLVIQAFFLMVSRERRLP
jgi:hypothetical protein